MKKCTPLMCKTFARFALAPARATNPKATLPRLTQEQIHPVDSIVVNCPYRNKDSSCRNKAETFETETYPAPEVKA
jgi:hypothetical protein